MATTHDITEGADMPIYSLATITSGASLRAVTESTDSHFFDAETMRYFNSRLLGDVFPLDGR